MPGESNLNILLSNMKPLLNKGEYVFCLVHDLAIIDHSEIILYFKEQEGITVVIKKEIADTLKLEYSFVASWISLTVHSSLEAIGLTAAFSTALARAGISCNVVAACFHDHIFVDKDKGEKAMEVLIQLQDAKIRGTNP